MNNKEDSLKEKFKLALISTAKVISDDYKINDKNIDKKSGSSNDNFDQSAVLELMKEDLKKQE